MNLKHTEKIALRSAGFLPSQIRDIQHQEETIVHMERKIEQLMSEQEYDVERRKLQETYGDGRSSIEARAKADTALCKLFVTSQWTQERLAKKEGITASRISQRLVFGRFLTASESMLIRLPQNLTERRFHGYWLSTGHMNPHGLGAPGPGKRAGPGFAEEARFEQILRLIEEDTVARQQNRPKIGKDITEAFADGKWHDAAEIAAKVDAPEEHVIATLVGMRDKGTYKHKAEQREVGNVMKYRLFREAETVGTDELAEKLKEPLARLREQGKANMATMSPPTVAFWTAKIQTLLDEWAGKPEKETGLRKVAF